MSGVPILVTGIESQPDFPGSDLSDTNAELLELMLANASLVENGHRGAERASWVYRVGHPALRLAGGRVLTESSYAEAFNHGISSYETIAALLHTVPENGDMFIVNANAVALVSVLEDGKLLDYIDSAAQKFNHELPRTSEVILDSSERFYRTMARYAVFGAALARQFELDSTE
jgi:hypothetical protein